MAHLLWLRAVVLTDMLLWNIAPVLRQLHHAATVHQAEAELVADVVAASIDGPAAVHAWDPRAMHHDVLNISPC